MLSHISVIQCIHLKKQLKVRWGRFMKYFRFDTICIHEYSPKFSALQMANSTLQFTLACFSGFQMVKLHPQYKQTTISSTYEILKTNFNIEKQENHPTSLFLKSYEAK